MGKHIKNDSRSYHEEDSVSREWDEKDDQIDFEFLKRVEDLTADDPYSPEEELLPSEPEEDGKKAAPGSREEPEEAPKAPVATKERTEPRPAPKKPSPTGTKKKKHKKKDRFRTGLIVYLLVLLVLIIGTLALEWVALDRSQKRYDAEAAETARIEAENAERIAHEKAVYQAPQKTFEAWLAGTDADYWTDLWYQNANENLDGRDRVREYIDDKFSGAEAFKSLDYTAETPVYVLKNGEETLARITLAGSDVNWAVSDVTLQLKGDKSASARVAAGSRVFCNGTELGAEYVTDSSSYFRYDPLRDKLVNPVTWDTYTVDGLLLEPELRVDPPAGAVITQTAEGDYLLCLGEEAGKPYRDKSVAFVKAYLFYYMSGYNGTWGNLYGALAYLTPGYQAYKDLQDTYNGVVWNTAYGNIDTSNTTAGDVVIWADNCYSVDVTYDANCTLNGQQIDYADATMRIYFLKTDAGYVISNFETL